LTTLLSLPDFIKEWNFIHIDLLSVGSVNKIYQPTIPNGKDNNISIENISIILIFRHAIGTNLSQLGHISILINTYTMPVKYKPTQSVMQRGSKKVTTTHYYMKTQSLKELLECYNNDNTKPKLRQKVKNELIRRQKSGKLNIVTRDTSGNISEFK
jgi:hypothetical protein